MIRCSIFQGVELDIDEDLGLFSRKRDHLKDRRDRTEIQALSAKAIDKLDRMSRSSSEASNDSKAEKISPCVEDAKNSQRRSYSQSASDYGKTDRSSNTMTREKGGAFVPDGIAGANMQQARSRKHGESKKFHRRRRSSSTNSISSSSSSNSSNSNHSLRNKLKQYLFRR